MYNSHKEHTNWVGLIDGYANAMLFHLGIDKYELKELVEQYRENWLVKILRDDPDQFVQAATDAGNGSVNLIGVCRLVALAQIMVYDITNGPDGDGKSKALRRHWYSYFKKFAQMFGHATGNVVKGDSGKMEIEDLKWTQRLSQVYASFVDSGECTYLDLWVEDASRMMDVAGWDNRLIDDYTLIMGVEKDSLFKDFKFAARAAGAVALISGKGKNSKAATELLLRELGWGSSNGNGGGSKLRNNRNIVIHLSDHDTDGEEVIGPTFADQMRRYIEVDDEGRVGITPGQPIAYADELQAKGLDPYTAAYEIKLVNRKYREWADEKGIYMAHCRDCDYSITVTGIHDRECSECGTGTLEVDLHEQKSPRGYEVEALSMQAYYKEIGLKIIELVGWDNLVEGLRDRCVPDAWNVAYYLGEELASQVDEYNKIQEAINLLNRAADTLITEIRNRLHTKADSIIDYDKSWRWIGSDPYPDEYVNHIVSAGQNGYGEHWMPFSRHDREEMIRNQIREDGFFIDEEIKPLGIDDFDEIVEKVIATLQ